MKQLELIPPLKDQELIDHYCLILDVLKSYKKLKFTLYRQLHHLENKIEFINIDIDKYTSNKYDLILSNPPYIENVSLNRLDYDVKFYEQLVT